MNFNLTRTDYLETGIFGTLRASDGSLSLQVLEHSYPTQTEDGTLSLTFYPKVPIGTYQCVRGIHHLEGAPKPFETFEIKDIPGHSNILFHVGNFNEESHGCLLLGLERGTNCVMHSKLAFEKFMNMQIGTNEFTLTVC